MTSDFLNFNTAEMLIRVPVVLLSLTVHEFCHAYFALRMGDPTAYRMGRCSLNPLRHLDPLGTLCLMFAPIGWAKPVPINAENFRFPPRRTGPSIFDGRADTAPETYDHFSPAAQERRVRRGMLVATAAGPLSNLALAILFALLVRLGISAGLPMVSHLGAKQGMPWIEAYLNMMVMGVLINCGLAIFNCLPVFPLDGFHIALGLQRPQSAANFAQTARFGPFIILGIVLLGNRVDLLGRLIDPVALFLFKNVAGMP